MISPKGLLRASVGNRSFGRLRLPTFRPLIAGGVEFEDHLAAVLLRNNRAGLDVFRVGKADVHIFGGRLAIPRCGIRLEQHFAVADPLVLVVMDLSHRGNAHEVNCLPVGIVGT